MPISRLRGHFVLFALLNVLAATPVMADDNARANEAGRVYLPSDNPLADVDQTLARARADDRLALIIMGANWCHDSRALAARLQEPAMTPVIEANYEVAFVDVAYLDAGMEVIRRFGQPVIYGTPTVLIVDPSTERVINFDTSPRWRNAYNIGIEETVDYFTAMAKPAARLQNSDPVSPQLAALLADIDAWELAQSERLYEAFEVLAPMLRQYDAGNAPDEFKARWDQVAVMRAQITGDLAMLRARAREQAAAGDVTYAVVYPEYPPFAWEPAP